MKVRCPRKGCNYVTTAEAAKDAMEDMKEHLRQVHGIDHIPDSEKESIEGEIKTSSRSRM